MGDVGSIFLGYILGGFLILSIADHNISIHYKKRKKVVNELNELCEYLPKDRQKLQNNGRSVQRNSRKRR